MEILRVSNFKGFVRPDYSTKVFSLNFLGSLQDGKITPQGIIVPRDGESETDLTIEISSVSIRYNAVTGYKDKIYLVDTKLGYVLEGFLQIRGQIRDMLWKNGFLINMDSVSNSRCVTFLKGGKIAKRILVYSARQGPSDLFLGVGTKGNERSVGIFPQGQTYGFVDIPFPYGSNTVHSVMAVNYNGKYPDAMIVSADSETAIVWGWLSGGTSITSMDEYRKLMQVGYSWLDGDYILLFIAGDGMLRAVKVRMAGTGVEVAHIESDGYYVVAAPPYSQQSPLMEKWVYVWTINFSGRSVRLYLFDKEKLGFTFVGEIHPEIDRYEGSVYAWNNFLYIAQGDKLYVIGLVDDILCQTVYTIPGTESRGVDDVRELVVHNRRQIYLSNIWTSQDGAQITAQISKDDRSREGGFYDVIRYGKKLIFTARGMLPVWYDTETEYFEPISIGPAPGVELQVVDDSSWHGGAIAVCVECKDGRKTPWAIVDFPPGKKPSILMVRPILRRWGIIEKPLEENERGVYDHRIRAYGIITRDDLSSAGNFVDILEDYPEARHCDLVLIYDEDSSDPPRMQINVGNMIGYMSVLPPQDEPPMAAFGALFKGRLFLANTTEHPNRVWWSDLNISHFDLEHWWFDIEEGEEIMGLLALDEVLYIFGKRSVWLLAGDPPVFGVRDGFRADVGTLVLKKIYDKGIPVTKAFAREGNIVFFFTGDGIYVIEDGQVRELTVALRGFFRGNRDFKNARLYVVNRKLYFLYSEGGVNKVLAYDFESASFSLYNRDILALDRGYEDARLVYYGVFRGQQKLLSIDTSDQYWNGSAWELIHYNVSTVDSNLGLAGVRKRFKKLYLDILYETFSPFIVNVSTDGGLVLSKTVSEEDIRNGIELNDAVGEILRIDLHHVPYNIEVLGFIILYDEIDMRPSSAVCVEN